MLDLKLPKKNGLFITGTGRGVGKTLVTGGIADLIRKGFNFTCELDSVVETIIGDTNDET